MYTIYKWANSENCTRHIEKRKLFGHESRFIAVFITKRLHWNRGFCAFFRICSFIVYHNMPIEASTNSFKTPIFKGYSGCVLFGIIVVIANNILSQKASENLAATRLFAKTIWHNILCRKEDCPAATSASRAEFEIIICRLIKTIQALQQLLIGNLVCWLPGAGR